MRLYGAKKVISVTTIVWVRNDFRFHDNPALLYATQAGVALPVYIWSPEEAGDWQPGEASRWWLNHTLGRFSEALQQRGSALCLRCGDTLTQLLSVATAIGATTVAWNRRYDPIGRQCDEWVEAGLRASGIDVQTFPGNVLIEPDTISTKDSKPFQKFTPFWNKLSQSLLPTPVDSVPDRMQLPQRLPASVPLAEMTIQINRLSSAHLINFWRPGEVVALERVEEFIGSSIREYADQRDYPALAGTSRLSPHLTFGELSVRDLWQRLLNEKNAIIEIEPMTNVTGIDTFIKELAWREFAYHVLWHFPQTVDEPMNTKFRNFPWRTSKEFLEKWECGETGYPIVDAGMRELFQTGWMHNRVRMIVASFLTKDLLCNWVDGARWFWDKLVDADFANNSLGWQWCAGCGADAAPYFRIFNPTVQSRKFDATGSYLRRFLPEIDTLPVNVIHDPWQASGANRTIGNKIPGIKYPTPIVNHSDMRNIVLSIYSNT